MSEDGMIRAGERRRVQAMESTEMEWLEHFGARVEEFRGEGQLALPNQPAVPCEFTCVRLEDGRILAECHLLSGVEFFNALDSGSALGGLRLEGRTIEGSDILVTEAYLLKRKLRVDTTTTVRVLLSCRQVDVSGSAATRVTPAGLIYGLSNLEFRGDEWTAYEVEGRRGTRSDTFRFQVASTEIVVRRVKDYDQVVEQMKSRRSLAVTAEASLELTRDPADLRSYDDIMGVICTLMSLAKGNRVDWIYSKLTDRDGELISMYVPSKLVPSWAFGGPLIGGATATRLKEFVAHSYDPYLQEQARFNLPVAIGYYLASKSETEWYTRFLLACIATETLVSNFAEKGTQKDLRWIVPQKDFKKKRPEVETLLQEALQDTFPGLSNDQIKAALAKVLELNRPPFRDQVTCMLEHLGIEYDDDHLKFVSLRHKVIHTGVLRAGIRETFGRYQNLICLLDKIFLKILDWEGEHLDYSDQVRLV